MFERVFWEKFYLQTVLFCSFFLFSRIWEAILSEKCFWGAYPDEVDRLYLKKKNDLGKFSYNVEVSSESTKMCSSDSCCFQLRSCPNLFSKKNAEAEHFY